MKLLKDVMASLKRAKEPKPGVNLDQVKFVVSPQILKRGGKYVLRYQVAKEEGMQLTRVVYHKTTPNKGYYFFSIPISHSEPGTVVERDLETDGLRPHAEKDAIYWLNQDGTEVHLPVHQE